MTIGLPLGIRSVMRVLGKRGYSTSIVSNKTRVSMRIPNGSPIVIWDCHLVVIWLSYDCHVASPPLLNILSLSLSRLLCLSFLSIYVYIYLYISLSISISHSLYLLLYIYLSIECRT